MSFEIAIAGKGGTGKTTIASFVIRYLLNNKLGPILAVDADSNANLNQLLGVPLARTIGEAREEMKREVPAGMTKEIFMEYKVQEALVEAEGFDLIAMGRPEGPGCYCAANSLLTKYLDILIANYKYIVVDNEAGMEHISRLTTKDVGLLLIISDPSSRGITTAARIKELTEELKIGVERHALIVNRVPGALDGSLNEMIKELGLELAGTIPMDEKVYRLDLEGRPMVELPEDSLSLKEAFKIMEGLIPADGGRVRS